MHKRLAPFLLSLLLLGSCSNLFQTEKNDSGAASLAGYWKSSFGDGFEISGTSYTQYDDAAKGISFAGTIADSSEMGASSGYVTLQITNTGSWGKTLGKYYTIRWKGLTKTGVQQSAPYKDGSVYNNGHNSSTEATAEFTVANGYFSYFGEYARQ